MKRIFGSMSRSVKNTNYQDRAVRYAEKIDAGKVKVNAPKYPTEKKYFEKASHDASLKDKIDEKHDSLIDNMNKITIHSTEPVERWTSTKDLPTRESEFLHRNDPAWEYGFYEPPPDKMEKDRLTFREALEIMRAKLELEGSKEFAREEIEKAQEILETHQGVARVDPERLERMWRYFRPFERRDTQKVVTKHKVEQLRDALHGRSDERRLLDGVRENFRKVVGNDGSIEKEQFDKLNAKEQEQFLLAVKEHRQMEHERLEKRLADMKKEDLEMERVAESTTKTKKELWCWLVLLSLCIYCTAVRPMTAVKRVVCAMSGGVDSSVSAWLLKKKGFHVTGVYMVNWDHVEEGVSQCPRTKDQADAQVVCDRLGIRLHVVNFVKEYWNDVFILLGRLFLITSWEERWYPILHAIPSSNSISCINSRLKNLVQTLLLLDILLEPLKLRRSMFPVGSLLKSEVRKIADSESLLSEVAHKPESMGICFIGKRKNFESFLDQYIEPVRGPIVDKETGVTIGEHSGIHHFTIGKRVKIAPEQYQSADGLFVCSLDAETNSVFVCRGSANPLLYARTFELEKVNWISGQSSARKLNFRCQRTHPTLQCEIETVSSDRMLVKPRHPIRAAAPGQTCVFYDSDICLGSGQIHRIVSTL
ncbi:hypothetical protein QR680_002379 [Steinernema hermaphroditum]|uniref:tRNA-5-taurinomethyluridine 2-sulfurtransferase n=1 Tax=Steinernema hermaphroditum TaxID=289476 RepID=A0AA39LHL6_9BILA|nr:hypothetical protein QR680_002379 [Steinernema hermaphroditum]